MDRLGETSNVLSEQQPAPGNDSDELDFNDVFGGPPRRFSSHERRGSSGGGMSEFEGGGKPVFGESSFGSPGRGTSNDFYDDIFRGSDDSYCSPRKSSGGSRIMSPAHPKFEPFSTSLPAQFSLPAKLTKAMDLPTFGPGNRSPNRYREGTYSSVHTPTTPLSRFSSRNMQGHDDLRNYTGQSSGPLSHESSSLAAEKSLYTENRTGGNSNGNTASKESPNGSSRFHFSIHRWPRQEVPLLVSLRERKKSTLKGSSKVSALSAANVQDADSPDAAVRDAKTYSVSDVVLPEGIEVKRRGSKLNEEIEETGNEEINRNAEGKENSETMTGLLNSNVGAISNKRHEGKKMKSNKKGEVNKSAVGLPETSGENLGKSRVKGKVKEFVKIINPEISPKSKMSAAARNLSSRWKGTGNNKRDGEVSDSTIELDSKAPAANVKMTPDASTRTELEGKIPVDNVKMMPEASSNADFDSKVPGSNLKTTPDASFRVEEVEKSSKQQFARNRTIKKLSDIHFYQMDASPSTESVPRDSCATSQTIDDPSLENFQVQELSLDEDKLSKAEEDSEAIRASDTKIQLWSNGRKGNIRSLLSTLQHVLWPESGWKPVALVDIIEANAVKKAYNRAMLCLHPDKLQQKGAAPHQKYMAEKVFDILQEAWDHFNSLGTLV